MLKNNEIIKILRNPDVIKEKRLGISIDQTFLSRKGNIKNYINNHRILSKVDEIWVLNLKNSTVEKKFINN